MKRQIESDKLCLDINTDVTDVKPPPQRNLRRRNNNNNNTAFDYNVDTDADSSVLIQSSALGANVIMSGATSSVNIVGGHLSVASSCTSMLLGQFSSTSNLISHANTLNGFYSTLNNGGLNNSISQNLNDRKRKLSPAAITFAINDEEMNEDFKFLIKNLNTPHTVVKQSPLATQQQTINDDAKSALAAVSVAWIFGVYFFFFSCRIFPSNIAFNSKHEIDFAFEIWKSRWKSTVIISDC